MSAILSPPPLPHRSLIRAEGMAGAPRIKSPDAKVSAMYPATETPKRQRKTSDAIDGVRKQISDSTVGQRLKVADRNHSASTSPASQMLMSLLGKVSPLGIFKVSAVERRARSAKRGTFRGAKLHRWTCQYRHYQILQQSVVCPFTFAGYFPNLTKDENKSSSLFF